MPNLAKISGQASNLITEGIAVNSGYNCRIERQDGQITARVRSSLHPCVLHAICFQIGNKTECALLAFVDEFSENYEDIRKR